MSTSESRTRLFLRLALATTALTYLLISVGAIVRVSGAGMGCPDWPTCFGLLIPPTSVEELPPLGSYSYPPGWRVESFDPLMTWIEYVNRLLGALVGLAILSTLIAAIASQRQKKNVLWPVVGAFVGVLYAGWLGARVVAHELAPWIVTVHLLSAIAVVSCLVIAVVNASSTTTTTEPQKQKPLAAYGFGVLLLAIFQGAVGTQVRGTLEDVARAHPELSRGELIDHIGALDFAHTALGLISALVVVAYAFSVVTSAASAAAARMAKISVGLTVLQLASGMVLAGLALPRAVQVLHLLFGALLLGALTATAMLCRRR